MKRIWKNIVELSRPQIKARCKRIACWIAVATNTPSGCVTRIAFPLQQCLHERASLLPFLVDVTPRFPILSGYSVVTQFRHP